MKLEFDGLDRGLLEPYLLGQEEDAILGQGNAINSERRYAMVAFRAYDPDTAVVIPVRVFVDVDMTGEDNLIPEARRQAVRAVAKLHSALSEPK